MNAAGVSCLEFLICRDHAFFAIASDGWGDYYCRAEYEFTRDNTCLSHRLQTHAET